MLSTPSATAGLCQHSRASRSWCRRLHAFTGELGYLRADMPRVFSIACRRPLGLSMVGFTLGAWSCTSCTERAAEAPPAAPEAAPAAQPSGATPARELSELDAFEHDLEVSERRLEEHLRVAQGEPSSGEERTAAEASPGASPAEESAAPQTSAPTPAARPPGPPQRKERSREEKRADDACALSCRALASMRRAEEGICNLVPGAAPCSSATERVERAVQKVRAAGCECRE